MDKHLNLFYSYDRGSRKDLEHLQQLEDNVTRSFIITLKNLRTEKQKEFLENLIGLSTKPKIYFSYDLQNIKDVSHRYKVKKTKNKILLCISREKANIEIKNITQKDKDIVNKVLKLIENKDEIIKTLKNEYKFFQKHNELSSNIGSANKKYGIEIDTTNILSIYELFVQDSRPDAWIYNDDTAILIEAKTGNDKIYNAQLFRHLNKSFGIAENKILNNKDDKYFQILSITWDDVIDSFPKNPTDLNGAKQFLIEQYKEYMIMCGEKLDLSFVVEKNGYDREKAKEQFPLLLEKLDKRIEESKIVLKRDRRALSDYLWDFYGELDLKNKVKRNPHYSIYFDKEWAGISFTITKNDSKVRKLLKSQELVKALYEIYTSESTINERYFIGLKNYELIDWKTGQIKGQTHETFNFSICLKSMKSKDVEREIASHLQNMIIYLKYSKQFSFDMKIEYPDIKKIKETDNNTLRKANRYLFEDYNKLLQEYLEFMKVTESLFDMIK